VAGVAPWRRTTTTVLVLVGQRYCREKKIYVSSTAASPRRRVLALLAGGGGGSRRVVGGNGRCAWRREEVRMRSGVGRGLLLAALPLVAPVLKPDLYLHARSHVAVQTRCCCTDSERPHRCRRLPNDFGSRRICKSVFIFLRQLTTRQCSRLLLSAGRAAIDR